MLRSVCSFIVFVAVYVTHFFFGISGLFGYEYTGAEESTTYLLYVIFVFISTLSVYLLATLKKGFKKGELVFIGFVGLILFFHFAWNALAPTQSVMLPNQLFLFFSISLVGALAGLSAVKLELISVMRRQVDIVALVFSTSVFVFAILPFLAGVRLVSIGGASYQFFSYLSAITFGLLVYANYIQPRQQRFIIFQGLSYAFLSHILMFFAALGVFLGGGRGAFILLIAYGLFAIKSIISIKPLSYKALLRNGLKLTTILLVTFTFSFVFSDNQIIQNGFNRTTSFIGGDGINLAAGSSGRDQVYALALQALWEQPLLGYGPFNVQEYIVRPHNFFLDIFLQFGIVIGLFLIACLILAFVRAYRKNNLEVRFVLFLGVYPIIMLQVSGSYLVSSEFWFVMSVLFVSLLNVPEKSCLSTVG